MKLLLDLCYENVLCSILRTEKLRYMVINISENAYKMFTCD